MFVSVCRDLQLEEYVDLYWRDYPSIISGFTESCLIDQGKAYLIVCNIIKSGNGQDMLKQEDGWSAAGESCFSSLPLYFLDS